MERSKRRENNYYRGLEYRKGEGRLTAVPTTPDDGTILRDYHLFYQYFLVHFVFVSQCLFCTFVFQTTGFFPEAVINLLTIAGSGFDTRCTDAMTLDELVTHVSRNNCVIIVIDVHHIVTVTATKNDRSAPTPVRWYDIFSNTIYV